MQKLLILALSLAPALAHADVKSDLARIDAQLTSCLASEDGQSMVGMKECTYGAYEQADKLLNKNYKQIVAGLKQRTGDRIGDETNAEILKRLVASERAWVAYRDAQANLEASDSLGGSLESLEYGDTLYRLTKERVEKLESIGLGAGH